MRLKNQEAKRNQQPNNAYLVNGTIPNEMLEHINTYLPEAKELSSLSISCSFLHSFFQPRLDLLAFKKLSQSVIDNDNETVKNILTNNPDLVFICSFKEHCDRKPINVATIYNSRRCTYYSS